MLSRLLFVDDDPALLKAIERNLCFDFDLKTADSGQLGLDFIDRDDAFTVIITDMKMPQMNGIQFIEKARKISPDSIYIMLTGNQDVETAIGAINDGSVFRFLNKPCSISDIKSAVNAGIRQHELVNAERDLLQKTFVGAVSVLTDVLESLRPETVQQSKRVDEIMIGCESTLGGSGSWEYRIAGRVGLVGFALLPKEEQSLFMKLNPATPLCVQILERIAATSARLLDRIPRMQKVSQIIQMQTKIDGSVLSKPLDFFNSVELGATLLRIAIHWTTMIDSGMTPSLAIKALRRALPYLTPLLEKLLLEMEQPTGPKGQRKVTLFELAEGMVLCEDAYGSDGGLLLRSGLELTRTLIEKIRMHCARSNASPQFLVETQQGLVICETLA